MEKPTEKSLLFGGKNAANKNNGKT